MIKNSKIYTGKVIHKRFKPKEHYFKYNVFSLLIDLNELEEINKYIKFFSYNKFNIISFYDKDHGDRDGSSIKLWVKVLKKTPYFFEREDFILFLNFFSEFSPF